MRASESMCSLVVSMQAKYTCPFVSMFRTLVSSIYTFFQTKSLAQTMNDLPAVMSYKTSSTTVHFLNSAGKSNSCVPTRVSGLMAKALAGDIDSLIHSYILVINT